MMVKDSYLKVAYLTAFLLFIPFIASFYTYEVNWALLDYVLMALLIFGFGSLFVYLSNRFPNYKLLTGVIILVIFLTVWAEFAVGIFT